MALASRSLPARPSLPLALLLLLMLGRSVPPVTVVTPSGIRTAAAQPIGNISSAGAPVEKEDLSGPWFTNGTRWCEGYVPTGYVQTTILKTSRAKDQFDGTGSLVDDNSKSGSIEYSMIVRFKRDEVVAGWKNEVNGFGHLALKVTKISREGKIIAMEGLWTHFGGACWGKEDWMKV